MQWRMLNAADFGDATTRTRFFLIARKDGHPITWPEPSHAKSDGTLMPGRQPWRAAREIIDWDNPGKSILDHPKYARKPLSEKTLRRIARGLERYGGPLAPLYTRLLDIPGTEENLELPTNSAAHSFIINRHGENGSVRCHPTTDPMPTATTRGAGYLVQTIASNFIAANRNHNAPRSIEEPIPTATTATGGGSFLIEAKPKPFMLGQQSSSAPRTTDHPTPTVATAGAISIVQPSIILYYGQSNAQPIEAPVTAITSCRKHALMSPTLIPCESQTDHDTKPAAALIELNHGNGDLGHQGNNRRVHSLDEPMPAITTSPGMAIVQPSFIQPDNAQTMDTREYQDIVDELISNDIDPRRLVIIDGQPYLLDILFRMLQNRELSRAMGFDDDDSQYEFVGNISEVTKQIGNAVPVKMAAALVKTILST